MPLKRQKNIDGTLLIVEHTSKILKGNPLGDPHVRKLAVWLPPQYDTSKNKRFPTLYDMTGFTGSGLGHTNWKPFGDNLPERASRLIREQKIHPPSAITRTISRVKSFLLSIGNFAPWQAASIAAASANPPAATAPLSTA
jgi:hypothetical protein